MSDIREAFESWVQSTDGTSPSDFSKIDGEYADPCIQAYWMGWQAALSANGGEAVGYTGSGSLDALKQGADGHIFPSPAPSHPVPLYLAPTVNEYLTVQSEPIGYTDPDTLADYRAGDRLHIPVYRPDASADWQDGIPVYLHPAPPSVAVPENEIKARALEEYADQLDVVFANAQEAGANDCPAWHAGQFAKDARKQAARLRTAGDEGEE